MNFLKKIYSRLIKNIELYNSSNISFGNESKINNGVVLNAQKGIIELGSNTRIGRYSELQPGLNQKIIIKDFSTLFSNCKVLGNITIERYCVLSNNIYISSGNHIAFDKPELIIRKQDYLCNQKTNNNKVHLEEDVWIGSGVFISSGVTIGRGAVIGSNAVVTKNVNPYEVWAGVPAKKIKNRLLFAPPNTIDHKLINTWPYFYRGFNHKSENDFIIKYGIEMMDRKCCAKLKSDNSFDFVNIIGYCSKEITLNCYINNRESTVKKVKNVFNLKLKLNQFCGILSLKLEKSEEVPVFIKTIKMV